MCQTSFSSGEIETLKGIKKLRNQYIFMKYQDVSLMICVSIGHTAVSSNFFLRCMVFIGRFLPYIPEKSDLFSIGLCHLCSTKVDSSSKYGPNFNKKLSFGMTLC